MLLYKTDGEKGVQHLPVVDENNRLLGIVTESDIRKAGPSDVDMLSVKEASSLLKNLKVSAFMTPKEKLVTITPDALIEEAAQLMHDHKRGCLPVVEGETLLESFQKLMPWIISWIYLVSNSRVPV